MVLTRVTWAKLIRAAHKDSDCMHSELRKWRKLWWRMPSDALKVKQFYDELDALLAG